MDILALPCHMASYRAVLIMCPAEACERAECPVSVAGCSGSKLEERKMEPDLTRN